ncbi:2-oxoglutarate dehydrogenase, E2 component, dihydrolipoamide succinyltransferase [Nocardioides antri]|uniref:Dihydrolipoamide acetyltransferase component of pyruvate dehydrogenase complex n=1 Tax=Nocardioides antri TaxID=2607659 RepID=A0A5B1LZZ2_9ACTN|nr:2-oxoglutarate dehydrogenase, E2 component, dihydrolipoamide succinyltransferase [Nocardioides antri]KAA1426485.1 2-oxoglutarate dehydrogenase, E2 component, dihydrolipoamide succinyltransferase [Nocardioides antri]
MATEVTLPALGESVTEGTVTRWLKQVGDEVAVDEALLEVSTDKVDTEIPSPVAGTLVEIKASEDETVEVGAVLALIGDAGEGSGGGEAPAEEAPAEEAPAQEAPAEESAPEPEPAAQEPAQAEQPSAPEAPAAEAQPSSGGSADGTPVTLPALGESVTEGTVTRWLKQVGDEVAVDEALLEVSTDKVDTEIPSPVAGTLLEIKASEDETVEVGAVLAIVGSGSPSEAPAQQEAPPQQEEQAPQQEEQAPAQQEEQAPAQQQEAPAQQQAPAQEKAPEPAPAPQQHAAPSAPAPAGGGDGPGYVTPLVRKLAAQHGVDLATVKGRGVGGRIRKQDVLDAAEAQKAAAAPAAPAAAAPAASSAPAPAASASPSPLRGQTVPVSRLRKIIAQRMVESLQTSAQLTQVIEVDVTNIARLREATKADFQAREGVKLSYLPFFAKAAIDALKQHPSLNATIDLEKGEVTYHDRENIAFAVDTEKGLLTPVVKDAGDLSVSGLAKKIADVAGRTRSNKIGPDELSGGTFTITNLGSVGALWDTPIINQPQVAILGPGAVVKRPVVIDDEDLGETIAVRHMVHLALTYDHRLVDGADAGRFLQEVKKRLEAGQFEV